MASTNTAPPSTERHFWFLNTLASVRVSFMDGSDGLSVLEHRAPFGDSPPLHVHRNEDEVFHLLDGQVTFQLESSHRQYEAGQTVFCPKGVPHTYRVDSAQGARWLTIIAGNDFERFVRLLGRKPERLELPPPLVASNAAIEALAAAASEHGIDLVGPPLKCEG